MSGVDWIFYFCCLSFYLFIYLLLLLLYLYHMEVPEPGMESKLELRPTPQLLQYQII